MAELPGVLSKILAEETDVESPVSEALMQKIGSNINAFFNDNINFILYTSSATWTKPSVIRFADVLCLGGGGGGGNATGNDGTAGASGGGSGGLSYKRILSNDLLSSVSVTVGSGGAASTAGGSSSFGSYLTGGGGPSGNNATSNSGGFVAAANTSGGTATGGFLNLTGGFGISLVSGNGRTGGNSPLGFGYGGNMRGASNVSFYATTQIAGSGFGSGGAGGIAVGNGVFSATANGSSGRPGLVIVIEHI